MQQMQVMKLQETMIRSIYYEKSGILALSSKMGLGSGSRMGEDAW